LTRGAKQTAEKAKEGSLVPSHSFLLVYEFVNESSSTGAEYVKEKASEGAQYLKGYYSSNRQMRRIQSNSNQTKSI
jgi:hypothetical protein